MDDNIELPPVPPVLGAPGMNLWIDDLRRAAVLADRERRVKVDAKPVVHSARIVLARDGYAWSHGGALECPPPQSTIIRIRWTADGRAWIDSERNRELARILRERFGATEAHAAADARVMTDDELKTRLRHSADVLRDMLYDDLAEGCSRTVQRIDALRAELEAAKRDAELLWANCRVIYFPDPSGSYPLEHNMRACGTKDSRADIEAALRIDAARKEK